METRKSLEATLLFSVAMLVAIGVLVWGGRRFSAAGDVAVLIAGMVMVALVVALYALSRALSVGIEQVYGAMERSNALVSERLEQFSVMLNLISEQQLISERAKTVAFRENDHEAMVRAIREEMNRGEFDAARLLVNDMENAYGYRVEADRLREEITSLYETGVRRAVAEAQGEIEHHCVAENWDQALGVAQRIATTYPAHSLATSIPDQVAARKEGVKQQLLARWRDAVAKKDIDQSIDILRALDLYVSPDEVAQLKDGALEIFKARIEKLRDQFKTAVHDKRWSEARRLGETLVQEYPTSKLAQEVRDMMETLKERESSEPVAAGI